MLNFIEKADSPSIDASLQIFTKMYTYLYETYPPLTRIKTYNGLPVDEKAPIFYKDNVLPNEELKALLNDLYSDVSPFTRLPRRDRYGRVDIPIFSETTKLNFAVSFTVTFSENNTIENINTPYTFVTPSLENVVTRGLMCFGEKYKLAGEISFACNLLEYNFDNFLVSIDQGGLHYDRFTEDTMIIMLTDPNDPKKGWQGGNLQFHLSSEADPRLEFSYSQNRGVFFSNIGTRHRFTSMEGNSTQSRRTILTLFKKEENTTFTSDERYDDMIKLKEAIKVAKKFSP